MKKIVYITQYTLYKKSVEAYEVGTDSFYLYGMGTFIAQELLKRDYPVICEVWRMDIRINKLMEKKIGGISCKIFPSKQLSILGKNLGEYSLEFKNKFKKEAQIESTVFHFLPNHVFAFSYYSLFAKKRRIVLTHLGGPNSLWKFKNQNSKASYLMVLLEKYILLNRKNTCSITISQTEAKYLEYINTTVYCMPVFGLAVPEILVIKDRKTVKEKLNIQTNKKIILQVGRATKERGFDWILDILDSETKEDYYWIFAGIHKEDEYYEELLKRNVYITNYLSRKELVDYYNIADILIFLINGKMDLEFGGTGYVPLESLACGTPVIATTFHHFPGSAVTEVSRIPEKKEDIVPLVKELLNENVSRNKCREIVLKEFSWDNVVKKHWEIYNS